MRTSKIKGKIYMYDPATGKMVEKKRPEVIEMFPMPQAPYEAQELEKQSEPQLYNVNYEEGRKLRSELENEELECPVPAMAHQLLNNPMFNPRLYVCECGAVCDPVSSEWRCAGSYWEHYHGYPMGHVPVFAKTA